MTAPATSHDPRGSVVRLPVGNVRDCLMCGGPPSWEINRKRRSCGRCLADALADFYATEWDGFIPAVVAPIRTGGAA